MIFFKYKNLISKEILLPISKRWAMSEIDISLLSWLSSPERNVAVETKTNAIKNGNSKECTRRKSVFRCIFQITNSEKKKIS